MGMLDDLAGKAGSILGGSGKNQPDMIGAVMNLLGGSQAGGLSGLVEKFNSTGLGDIVSSWIGKGENLPISGDQLKNVLGEDTLKNFAAKAGISGHNAKDQIAQMLPGIIDKLTPDGKLPEGNILEKGLNFLKSI